MAQAAAHLKPKPETLRRSPVVPKRLSNREFRQKAEALVEQIIDLLNGFDGDADSEPLLGSLGTTYDADHFNQVRWAGGGADDREGDEHDGREPDVEDEPSLGWTQDVDQEQAARNLPATSWYGNFEAEHDGREPSLGSLNPQLRGPGSELPEVGLSQLEWACGGRRDLEHDPSECGAMP